MEIEVENESEVEREEEGNEIENEENAEEMEASDMMDGCSKCQWLVKLLCEKRESHRQQCF